MNGAFKSFLSTPEQDRAALFVDTAQRLRTLPEYIEKDFWVCLVLDVLYNGFPEEHPKLLFKGGTSLSKAFGLVQRFSEDVDIVVYREYLGFEGERDPTVAENLSNKKRKKLFEELRSACSTYILEDMKKDLTILVDEVAPGCRVFPDPNDQDGQTLLVEYPSMYTTGEGDYVVPQVKIEAGARSALDPNLTCTITPYIADELPDWSLEVENVTVIAPERTYLDKLLILHGVHCGYRDTGRLPGEKQRISRHYYDAAMITATDIARSALSDTNLLDDVRAHNMLAFRQAWKKLEDAVPGSLRLLPQEEPRAVIERDYAEMQEMLFGDAPDFGWIMEQLKYAESMINKA
ncbi:MAG: nucleotidyl transferase AbiEii/AbiGii toxin family protein [Candidatus Dadabacteria bacterium]|nr:nucleotidyl transferase AbiEii/AbiGii toxin family protein [Candidatus Dadabacteria bacterium]